MKPKYNSLREKIRAEKEAKEVVNDTNTHEREQQHRIAHRTSQTSHPIADKIHHREEKRARGEILPETSRNGFTLEQTTVGRTDGERDHRETAPQSD